MDPVGLPPEVAEFLASLGLSSTELRAYTFLLKAQAATPTSVARETGQSRGRIYETLRLLVEKGLIREEPTRPIQYIPVPLAEVLATSMAETSRRAQLLKQLYASVARRDEAPKAQPVLPITRPGDIAVFSGRRSALAEQKRMLSQAQEYFLILGGGQLANRLAASPDFLQELRAALHRGVRVELYFPAVAETERGRELIGQEAGREHVFDVPAEQVAPASTTVTESVSLVSVYQPDDDSPTRGDDVAVLARSPSFVQAALHQFRPFQIPGALPSAPGRGTGGSDAAVVPELDTEAVGVRFLQSIAEARQDVVSMGPKGWVQFLKQGWQATLGVYAGAKRRGVRFRALTTDAPEDRDLLASLAAIWELRVTTWVPVWLMIIDRKELFQAYASTVPGEPPRLRYSNEPSEIKFYGDLFQRLWGQAQPVESGEVASQRVRAG